jgi:hypothetical protein
METLTSSEFYDLPFDELIQIRVHAVSYAGPKPGEENWSAVNIEGARTRQRPS